jgi:hypothetical protein
MRAPNKKGEKKEEVSFNLLGVNCHLIPLFGSFQVEERKK